MNTQNDGAPKLDVLFQDNHLLVINKPAPLATMGAESGETAHSLAADYIKHKYNKPGKAFVGIVSRLDSMTTGALVMARTSKAASRLSAQFAGRSDSGVGKVYLAAVAGTLAADEGEFVDFVRKDDEARRMRVVDSNAEKAQEARLRYVTLGANDETTVVAIQLLTGRKHQIRVQFADRGHAIEGDRKYSSRRRFPCGVALHSWRLQIIHPTLREEMLFEAPLPKSWKGLKKHHPNSIRNWPPGPRCLWPRHAFHLVSNHCQICTSRLQSSERIQPDDDCIGEPLFVPNTIVSGGQTGVDRAALDVAIAMGLGHGGWCPAGRLAEDGSVPSRYELQETDSREYPVRTKQNVIDSDATLILFEHQLKGGTLLTKRICNRVGKPHLALQMDAEDAEIAREWLRKCRPQTLNVAGPRESTSVGIFHRSMAYLLQVLAGETPASQSAQ